MVYTVTFNPALDFVMNVDNLTTDDINRTTSEELYYGGKGINVSTVLSRLHIPTISLGFVGGFTGLQLENMMKNDGLRTEFVHLLDGYTRINVKVKYSKELDINSKGPEISDEKLSEFFKKLDLLSSGDFLVLAGSVPSGMSDNIYAKIAHFLVNKNVRIIVDTTGNQLLKTLPYKPFLVKPNHNELGELFGKTLTTTEDIVKYAKELKTMGAQNVIVSRGKDGSVLVDENGIVHIETAVNGKLVNSVGCGDSMVAGFIAGVITHKNDYAYALKLATACASATAFSKELAKKEEIDEIMSTL